MNLHFRKQVRGEVIELSDPNDPDEKYYVHKGLLGHESHGVYTDCVERIGEIRGKVYSIPSAGDGTLIRFIEWLYHSNYTTRANGGNNSESEDDDLDALIKPSQLNRIQDEELMLLSHVRMYSFAHNYRIAALKLLALNKLRSGLQCWNTLQKEDRRILSFVKAFMFAYSHLPAEDTMRQVLRTYAAANLSRLCTVAEFRTFMGGPALDVMPLLKVDLEMPNANLLLEWENQEGTMVSTATESFEHASKSFEL